MLELRARKKLQSAGRNKVIEMIHQGLQERAAFTSRSTSCANGLKCRAGRYYRPVKSRAEDSAAIGGTDQGDDRGKPIVWLPDRGASAEPEQEHGTADLSNSRAGKFGNGPSVSVPGSKPGSRLRKSPMNAGLPICRVWAGRDGWATFALVADCCSRELLGWHLSRSGKAKTAESALEQALIARFGTLGKVEKPFLLRSDNGLVFTSRSYGVGQKLRPAAGIHHALYAAAKRTGGAPDPDVEAQCVHRHRFETLQHASRVIGDWINFYNQRRPHQALGMKTPAEAYALAG